jgi:hypothetical protein
MKASLLGTLPAAAVTTAGCAPNERYEAAVRALRGPLRESAEPAALAREVVRCATLAANNHNTPPWKFAVSPDWISIRPDVSRRTPAVDPDDHHVWVSVGCATENLTLAAALGVRTAFVKQPIEVPAVRSRLAEWLGLGSQRPDLVARFGRGPLLPYSLRRPVTAVIG